MSISSKISEQDVMYMRRCLQLARLGEEWVAPNPMVGAVIVHHGSIIGEGWHRMYGGPHAEPNAIASVADEAMLPESTMYVSLEPCAHYGKTPPCARLLAEKRLKRVVIGMLDPNPLVSGRGVEILREAGIEVEVGVIKSECRELNKRFLCLQERRRPYITLKWAQSADGFLDHIRQSAAEPVALISNAITKQQVHQMRARNMAILVGTRTALLDNPRLRTTRWSGRSPLRVVIDRRLCLQPEARLLADDAPTLVLSELEAYGFETSAEVVKIDFGRNIWPQVMEQLALRNIHSLIVEGGRKTLDSLLSIGLYDEIHVEVSPRLLGSGVQAPGVDLGGATSAEYDAHRVYVIRKD